MIGSYSSLTDLRDTVVPKWKATVRIHAWLGMCQTHQIPLVALRDDVHRHISQQQHTQGGRERTEETYTQHPHAS